MLLPTVHHCPHTFPHPQVPGGQWVVLLRNPWGIVQWAGPWGQGSKKWNHETRLHLEYEV